MLLKIDRITFDESELTPLLEERLGPISEIESKYQVVIFPSKFRGKGDLLAGTTPDIRNLIRGDGISVAIAAKEPHKYLGLYADDIILPSLIIFSDVIRDIVLGLIASWIYDKYLKSNNSDNSKVKFEYITLDVGGHKFERITMEGTISDYMKSLESDKIR